MVGSNRERSFVSSIILRAKHDLTWRAISPERPFFDHWQRTFLVWTDLEIRKVNEKTIAV